jgi:hypothetical protein
MEPKSRTEDVARTEDQTRPEGSGAAEPLEVVPVQTVEVTEVEPPTRPEVRKRMGRLGLLREFGQFLRQEGKWWLIPIVVVLVVLGVLLVMAESSVLAPFIYTLF